jgi:hypothetical protein
MYKIFSNRSSHIRPDHTAGLDTIFGHYFCSNLYGRAPRGPRGVEKSDFFFQIKLLSFSARIAPKRHKIRKIIKIEKKCQKNFVFLEYFKYSSIWGQY